MAEDRQTPDPERVGEAGLGGARAVSELAAAVARLEDFARAAADWVWETDRHHNYSYLSDGITRTLGVPPQALLGQYVFQLTYIDDSVMGIVNDMQAHQPFRNVLVEANDPEGGRHQILFCGVPVYQQGGVFRGYRGTALDVSQRVAVGDAFPERLSRIQDISELAVDWFWESDAGFLITELSDGYSAATGLSRSKSLGCDLRDLWFGDQQTDAGRQGGTDETLPLRSVFRLRATRWRRGDALCDFLISGKPLFDSQGQLTGYRGIGLALETDRVETVPERRAETPEEAQETPRAEQSAAAPPQPGSEASPALAPAGSIDSVFGAGLTKAPRPTNDEGVVSAQQQESTKPESPPANDATKGEMVDVAETIEECLLLMLDEAQKAGVELSGPEDGLIPFLRLTPEQLRQVLLTLLENAIEHAPVSGRVSVDAMLETNGAHAIEVGVLATADGSLPKNVTQLPVTSGLGAEARDAVRGMTVARAIIDQNDGELRFVSDDEGWARAIVEFPAARVIQEHEDPDSWKILF